MEHYRPDYQHQQYQIPQPSSATTIATGIGLLYVLHQVLVYFEYLVLSPQELVWNALVYVLPKQLLLDRARRHELEANNMLSQTHAAKSDALRRILGVGGNTVLQKLPAEGIMRRASSFGVRLQPVKSVSTSDAPAGLGNWDNSCYQNSVLQGLASLDGLKPYLMQIGSAEAEREASTTASLLETVDKLNDPSNNGRQLWTPAKLKSMSSWQQQDAQEYFSKIMEELDKEAAKLAVSSEEKPGLESIVDDVLDASDGSAMSEDAANDGSEPLAERRNPLDGLLAQRVTCTRCGHSEGLSMIPFNCLTVPLGSHSSYTIEECLDEYTKLEEIPEVECAKCTVLRAQQQLEKMLPRPPDFSCVDATPEATSKTLHLPPELRAQAFARLSAMQQALAEEDFADKTLNETCSIPKKARVSSTKTRQAVIGRSPKSLVVHVNRSVFDEMTGMQRKNYASVRFPATLDLAPWLVRTEHDEHEDHAIEKLAGIPSRPSTDSLSKQDLIDGHQIIFKIKAVVTHYGRHENGHYICYRQHPVRPRQEPADHGTGEHHEPEDDDLEEVDAGSSQTLGDERRWWCLSDEEVSPVSETEVLAQSGVFMLFYEREDALPPLPSPLLETVNGTNLSTTQLDTVAEASALPVEAEADSASHSLAADAIDPIMTDPTTAAEPAITPLSSSVSTAEIDSASECDAASPSTKASTTLTTDDELEDPDHALIENDVHKTSTSPHQATLPFMRTARQASHPDHLPHGSFGDTGFRAVAAT